MNTISISALRFFYWLSITSLIIAGGMFYYFQNHAEGIGGHIALPKLLWLACAIWLWYIQPVLIASDVRVPSRWRKNYELFWLNNAARAAIELWMMYVTHNWHPYLGIGHDLFSIGLVLYLLRSTKAIDVTSQAVRQNLLASGAVFIPEMGFAWYMLTHVRTNATIFFVPELEQHAFVLSLTWLFLILIFWQQWWFAVHWIYASIEQKSENLQH